MSNNKRSVKFVLAPRPQRDPLAADHEAPQHVLVPKGGLDLDKVKERLPDFESVLFESKDEEKVGMLERAHLANGMTFDPELLQAMSKDFDYEDPQNVIDDDFMDQAGGLIEDEGELPEDLFDGEAEVIRFEDMEMGDDYDDDNFEQVRRNYDKSGTKTFSRCSMTSSVMRKSQGLQQIDEHFERLYEDKYADDTEIGALDLNEVKGDELLTNMDQIRQMKDEIKTMRMQNHKDDYVPELVSDHHKNAIIGDDETDDEELVEVEVKKRENRVDCESILSYNSNLYNHPKLIVDSRRKRTSQSSDVQMSEAPSQTGAQSIASSRATLVSKLSSRNPDESPEERRLRKKNLKEYRQERRQEKKQNRQIFKAEQAHLVKQQIKNIAAMKLA